ncbi:hypothetical protein BaRGS_00025337 [Batillaria attramentaria]|uniref:Uncharacterized protein n=1 Tax=Batillaria attramentaria TaxID=370345 RepID=A0ABD0K8J6_9CAEN
MVLPVTAGQTWRLTLTTLWKQPDLLLAPCQASARHEWRNLLLTEGADPSCCPRLLDMGRELETTGNTSMVAREGKLNRCLCRATADRLV